MVLKKILYNTGRSYCIFLSNQSHVTHPLEVDALSTTWRLISDFLGKKIVLYTSVETKMSFYLSLSRSKEREDTDLSRVLKLNMSNGSNFLVKLQTYFWFILSFITYSFISLTLYTCISIFIHASSFFKGGGGSLFKYWKKLQLLPLIR